MQSETCQQQLRKARDAGAEAEGGRVNGMMSQMLWDAEGLSLIAWDCSYYMRLHKMLGIFQQASVLPHETV